MRKLYLKELKKITCECGFNIYPDMMNGTPFVGIYHCHEWDHGYESGCGYDGTRREFYADMREVLDFIIGYIEHNRISKFIAAPFYKTHQFSGIITDSTQYIYQEICDFLKKCKIHRRSQCGVELEVEGNISVLEMLLEGAFQGISELCVLFPEHSVIMDFTHHFDVGFFTGNFEAEKRTVMKLLCNYKNLRYYEGVYQV